MQIGFSAYLNLWQLVKRAVRGKRGFFSFDLRRRELAVVAVRNKARQTVERALLAAEGEDTIDQPPRIRAACTQARQGAPTRE